MYEAKEIRPAERLPLNNVRIIRGGKNYFELLIRLINEAKDSIHLQTYIYDDDETGIQVAEALKAAALREVAVYLMTDGYASQVMAKQFINELKKNDIHFRFFEPLLKSRYFYFGRRMHHKVAVIDSKYSLVGGINITNRYNDMPGAPAWLDFALYAEGEISNELHLLCWKTWHGFSVKTAFIHVKTDPFHHSAFYGSPAIRMRRNDWVRRKNQIYESYLAMFSKATSQITIVCSYFLPGRKLRDALSKAARRGVDIRVLVAGRSDIMVTKHAERWLYDWLLRNKIKVYEYQPTVLHAKLAICDSSWFTIGSYNINNISAYASIELNLDVYDPVLSIQAEQMINDIITKDAIPITEAFHKRSTNIFKQVLRWFSYHFIRVVFNLVTSYYKQRG